MRRCACIRSFTESDSSFSFLFVFLVQHTLFVVCCNTFFHFSIGSHGFFVRWQIQDPALQLELAMDGIWRRAFGIPSFSLGNLIGGVQLTARPPWFASLTLGATLSIGDPYVPAKAITGKVYARLDIANPSNCYFYGQVSNFTLGTLLQTVFGVSSSRLPRLLADTGFPEGVLLSWSATGTTTSSGDDVPAGFQLKGKAVFLGKYVLQLG